MNLCASERRHMSSPEIEMSLEHQIPVLIKKVGYFPHLNLLPLKIIQIMKTFCRSVE